MKLSTYFSLDEFVFSQVAARQGIDNSPTQEILAHLVRTAAQLDGVRELLGSPVLISSGYRCLELNEVLRGSATSSHMQGLAADFICPGFGSVRQVFDAIRKSPLPFDQLIVEYGRWVHIGYGDAMRRQVLAFNGNGYREVG